MAPARQAPGREWHSGSTNGFGRDSTPSDLVAVLAGLAPQADVFKPDVLAPFREIELVGVRVVVADPGP